MNANITQPISVAESIDCKISRDNSNRQNETLTPSDAIIHDVVFKDINNNAHRIIPVSNSADKNYYFMTDCIDPGFIKCNIRTEKYGSYKIQDNHKYNVNFSLNSKSYKDKKLNEVNDIAKGNMDNDNECYNNDCDDNDTNKKNEEYVELTEGQNIINKLNSFKRGLIDRVKFLMQVPKDVNNQSMYYMNVNMIKIGNDKKLRNIVEYNNITNNLSVGSMINILKYCRCKLLFQINSLDILQKGVYLNIRLVRVYPENLDTIPDNKKIFVLRELSTSNIRSIVNIDTPAIFMAKTKAASKYQVRDELKKILLV
jgi:hypothetical protein